VTSMASGTLPLQGPSSGAPIDVAGDPARVSVVIAAYTTQRWDRLQEAVASVRAQSVPAFEIIVVVDHNPELLAMARDGLGHVTVIPSAGSRGASGTRNTGVSVSSGEIIAFLDDDAVASPTWLESLLPHFAGREVVGVGGRVEPIWAVSRPHWFPPEFDWVVGVSYRGMPQGVTPVRNVWSNNMAIRRRVFLAIGGFRDDFGKTGERARPEDTDLCLRATAAHLGGTWVYEPAAIAGHWVPVRRATVGYFLRRCFNEGCGKAALSVMDGSRRSTSVERQYAQRLLLRLIIGGPPGTAPDARWGIWRRLAVAAGLSSAAVGFLIGQVLARGRRGRPELA
jgi:cellulose synthase/poly-beta-1,6-N-acetylglucosamine synthase-like glycosyltransferase